MTTTRRRFLARSLAMGCSLAASPLVTPVTLASAPGDARLVVIVLRGGMDGLDVLQPVGDRDFRRHRPTLAAAKGHDLGDFFRLHNGLAALMPLWRNGELGFAHATSTPYRDRRSHFDGQDMLENGSHDPGGQLTPGRDGWLNRALALLPGTTSQTALAVGRERLLLLKGAAPASSWSPDGELDLSPQTQLLLESIYAQDPLFHVAAMQAIALSAETENAPDMSPRRAGRAGALAGFTATRLQEDTRIAAFSLGGWDTHVNQANSLPNALGQLAEAILTLKAGLGPLWQTTTVLCLTEFGRTVRENGSRGTDHGTGGVAVFAGGALNGGQVAVDWPGLGTSDLLEDRDLRPTRDVRSYAAWALRARFGLTAGELDSVVFPGLDLGADPRLFG